MSTVPKYELWDIVSMSKVGEFNRLKEVSPVILSLLFNIQNYVLYLYHNFYEGEEIIDFLTRTGNISDEQRMEMLL